MGFWHTGYMEFHEPLGLDDFRFEPLLPRFPCKRCGKICSSLDELRKHQFENHPLHRPILFLQGRELGAQLVCITQAITADDVSVEGCDSVALNGVELSVRALSRKLAAISSDVCHVVLRRADVVAKFKLDFRIASPEDLRGMEEQFERTACGHRLDTRAIEEFISATARFGSAIGYCDGICAYLYGVLAREKAPDSSLPYEAYVGKYSKAAEVLAAYDRPLARTIGSLIGFHFNQFEEATRLADETRVGQVAEKYVAWSQGGTVSIEQKGVPLGALREALVTDWDTEQIIRWAVQPLLELLPYVDHMESFLDRPIAAYDRVKLHVLLGEVYRASGNIDGARKHGKTLRNLSSFERWAESMVKTHLQGS